MREFDAVTDFGDAMRARKRGGRKGKRRKNRCHDEKVKGGRWMRMCPGKRPRFISEAAHKAMGRR